jgi:capsule biosynthesis phosphatase
VIKENKVIVVDVDGTLTLEKVEKMSYDSVLVCKSMRAKLIELKSEGYWIILNTSRNMRTHEGNIGAIIKNTAPVLISWLEKNEIPYDELHFGKPWCGHEGFYIDDRAVRPREFIENTLDQINELLNRDKLKA